jgi:hypothetical protein
MSDSLARPQLLDLLRRLEVEGKATLVSLELDDPDLRWDTFEALCRYLGTLRDATAWWCADALRFGDAVYGFDGSQAEAVLGRSPETLRRWQWTAEKVPKSRRRVGLSFTHHETVAALEPSEQIRWLDHAEQAGLSANELRAAIRSAANTKATRSATNVPEAPGLPDPVDPVPISAEAVGRIELGAGDDIDRVCPTCGRAWQETLIEIEPKRKGEPWT